MTNLKIKKVNFQSNTFENISSSKSIICIDVVMNESDQIIATQQGAVFTTEAIFEAEREAEVAEMRKTRPGITPKKKVRFGFNRRSK
ncbi:MAG: hypothetical protein IT265_00025 [Saprospiraceae bacterium]|nr:hypothetical protein [Saprospiraceae bacterium]